MGSDTVETMQAKCLLYGIESLKGCNYFRPSEVSALS